MKKIYPVLFSTLIFTALNAQNFKWAKSLEVPADAKGIITDGAGNIYVYGTVIQEGTYHDNLSWADDNTGSFLTKTDSDGHVVFTKHWDQPFWVQDMVSAGDAIYFTGMFMGTVTINGHTILSLGRSDAFAGKLDLHGDVQWLTAIGGAQADYGGGLTLRADKSAILLTGGVTNELWVGGQNMASFTGGNTFVLELGTDGSYIRHKLFDFYPTQFGSSRGAQIEADANGNYLLKCFQKGTPWNEVPHPVPFLGLYIYKLGPQLDTVWTKLTTTTGNYGYEAGDLACSPEGDAYLPYYDRGKYGGWGKFERFAAATGHTVWMLPTRDSYYTSTFYSNNNLYFIGIEGAFACPCPDAVQGHYVIKSFDKNNTHRYTVKVENARLTAVTADHQSNSTYVLGRFRSAPFALGNLTVEGEISDYYPYDGTFIAALEDQPTDVTELRPLANRFSVYPTPSDGSLNVEFGKKDNGATLRVTDLFGQAMLLRSYAAGEVPGTTQIDLTSLPSGLYQIELLSEENREVRRIVIR